MGHAGACRTKVVLGRSAPVCKQRVACHAFALRLTQAQGCRANVLMELPWDAERYAACLESCALREDLAHMAHGDDTSVGDRGSALSGGQRSRVALARALYSVSFSQAHAAVLAPAACELTSWRLTLRRERLHLP